MSAAVLASEAHVVSFPILPSLIVVPLLGTLLLLAVPKGRVELHRLVALLTSLTTGAIALWVLAAFATTDGDFQFVWSTPWVPSLDINLAFGIDGISLFLVVLTGLLFPIALLSSSPEHDSKGYFLWLTLLEAGCLGVFLSLDLFVFFLFFELTLVPLFFLIGKWGHGRNIYAASKFFLYTMAGSAFMLVAIVALAVLANAGPDGGVTFDLVRLANDSQLGEWTARVIFLGFMAAFLVKVPVFPFHTWLPDAHTEAPTAGSVVLAGVLLKLGTYGMLRFGLYLFPEAAVTFAPGFIALGTIGIVYGGIAAAMQKNLKRLVAYSSVAHMGFCVLGIFVINQQGLAGSIVQMVNHGIITGALFILLGFLYQRRHTYEISKLVGLQKLAPVFAGVFTLFMLASIGLPGLAGFVGEFLVLIGAFVTTGWWAAIPTTGVIVAAIYMLWAYQRTFHGTPDPAHGPFPEIRIKEFLPLVPLVALTIFLGLYPTPMLERMQPSIDRLLDHVEAKAPDFTVPESQFGEDLEPVDEGDHGDEGSAEHAAIAEEGA